jgi:diguanylate cyclase (GGDEF)-like protein
MKERSPMLYVRRSIGRKLMLAVGVPALVFTTAGVLWLRQETTGPVYRVALIALGVFAAAIGSTFVLAIRRLVRSPLKRLVAAMKHAQAGDFLYRVPVESEDEIGRLARTYNETLAALTDLNTKRIDDALAMDALQRELRVKEAVERRARELSFLVDLARTLASTLELEPLLGALVERVVPALGLEAMEVLLAEEATGDLVVRAVHGGSPRKPGDRLPPGAPLPGLETTRLSQGDEPLGLLALRKAGGAAIDADEARLVDSVAGLAAIAIANARLHQKMVRLSQTDALTGAHNRRSLFARLDQEIERSRRFEHPMAVALVDVDRFREYNEALGHAAGDAVLRTVARLLGGAVRRVDLVARYGGEEFAVVLARADRAAAHAAAEKLRATVEAAALPHPVSATGRVNISVGVAVFPEDGGELGALVDAADAALFAAKRAGRNVVRGHEPGMRSHPGRRRDGRTTGDAEHRGLAPEHRGLAPSGASPSGERS